MIICFAMINNYKTDYTFFKQGCCRRRRSFTSYSSTAQVKVKQKHHLNSLATARARSRPTFRFHNNHLRFRSSTWLIRLRLALLARAGFDSKVNFTLNNGTCTDTFRRYRHNMQGAVVLEGHWYSFRKSQCHATYT